MKVVTDSVGHLNQQSNHGLNCGRVRYYTLFLPRYVFITSIGLNSISTVWPAWYSRPRPPFEREAYDQ